MVNEVNLDKIMPKVHVALDKLLQKNDFDSLTVKSLSEEIGFSRQYFYRAFSDKYALVTELFEYDLRTGAERFFTLRAFYTNTLELVFEKRKIYKSIFSSSYSSYLYNIIYNYCYELIKTIAELSLRSFTVDQDNKLRLYLLGVCTMLERATVGSEHFTKAELNRIFFDNVPSFLEPLKDETVTKDYIMYKIKKYREKHIF